jgi:hypothetical protein
MPRPGKKRIASQTKITRKHLKKVGKLLKNIPTTNLGHCIDFSAMPSGALPNPFSVVLTGRTLTFSTKSPLGLEISPLAYNPGLRIPTDITILITGPLSVVVEVEISSFATLSWQAYNGAGVLQTSIPPPPAPHNIASYALRLIGQIERVEFVGNNEECIRQLCI